MTEQLCVECIEAEKKSGIDISLLLSRLTSIKGQELSNSEIIYLCLSLCRYGNSQIAYRLYKHKMPSLEDLVAYNDLKRIERNMKSEMSSRVNYYVKRLMDLDIEKRKPSWSNVIEFLKKTGYEKKSTVSQNPSITQQKFFILCEGDQNKTLEEISDILRKHGLCTLTSGKIL
jgi:hypothetical protein